MCSICIEDMFENLTDEAKVKFMEWLHIHHEDFIQYSAMGKAERQVWWHYFPRPSTAEGYNTEKNSGEK